ncbi:hypothetical protein GLOIN_2v1764901 [Rhizophagus irregularis DAOM 181602=DAOM 197198]|nr:hypothetical protein GLOIN_2v1764901 [Rhizophagus irregularis DAOM 181602=DAOM 197198]
MLQPLLEKSEALYFGINGQEHGAKCYAILAWFCKSDLNNMSLKLENVPHRTHENMKQVINDGQGKEYSVHSVEMKIPSGNFRKYLYISVMNFKDVNFYARIICFRNLNIYEACVPDCMHHIDLGLFKYQLEFTQDILKAVGGTELQKKFDDQLRQIPRFLGLKLLHN